MHAIRLGHAAMEQRAFQAAAEFGLRRTGANLARYPCEKRRPIARLRGHDEVISPPLPRGEREALRDAWPWRHDDHAVEIGIAVDDAGGIGEYQRVDGGIRPRVSQAADQRRGQQHVANSAQRDDQDARALRQFDALDRSHNRSLGAAPADLSSARFFSAMPPAMPTPST